MPKAITPKILGEPLGMYSHGMSTTSGELVFVAGQVGIPPGGQAAPGDVIAQTKQSLENVRTVVEAAGCTMRDVVRLQTFLTRADAIAGFMKARAEVFPGYFPDKVYPPNTLLVISGLVRPELLVEIEAIAVRPARTAGSARRAGKPGGRTRATSPRRRARR
ncbi:MAG: RidA family protein [Candidatus Rokuibacteriota bacterium]